MAGTVVVAEQTQTPETIDALPEEEPFWLRTSSHRITLDGCCNQEKTEPGGLSVGKTTISLPPGLRNPQEL